MAISFQALKNVTSSCGHVRTCTWKISPASLLRPLLSCQLQLLDLAIRILLKLLWLAFELLKFPGDAINCMLIWLKDLICAGVSWLWSNKLVVKNSSASLLKRMFCCLLQRLKPTIHFLCQSRGLVLRLILIIKLPYKVAVAIVTSMKSLVSMVSRYCPEEMKVFWFDQLVPFTKTTALKMLIFTRTTLTLLGSLLKDAAARVVSVTTSSATNLFHLLHKTSSSYARSARTNANIVAEKLLESLTFHLLSVYQATSDLLERVNQVAAAALGNLRDVIVVHGHKLRVELSNAMNIFWEKAVEICGRGAETAADVLYDLCIDVYEAIVRSWMEGSERQRRLLRMPRVSDISAALGGGQAYVVCSFLLVLGLVAFVAWAPIARRTRTR